ncbi:DUF3597 domain-containing protein [Novosphingobium cyanobacteriorum]|uniref:DUF3597 domain-containing protein n=1 Tax=Novosphingobium cyanobacteriorum TaxID=3024215 RepID=A0ABT6CPD7_9SPHN|nr:DUF3597 domain-containing protein [Novosphingobium cyanobacteriorum]MDF8334172.1 DUF3597 domain-containing protein [Novosphingobium cyanobacteriorum]
MSLISKIMDAISFAGTRPTQTGQHSAPVPAAAPPIPQTAAPSPTAANAPAPPTPPAISQPRLFDVDVEARLTELAQGRPLDWRHSIVDLMKVIGLDSSLDNRKELARELGYTGPLDGSAEMNLWLHKAVMRKLAENGGKVPQDLTD